jgi:hypothetical protein
MEHPEVLRGARENGAMETTVEKSKGTTGMSKPRQREKSTAGK